jgi:hypothetical protein
MDHRSATLDAIRLELARAPVDLSIEHVWIIPLRRGVYGAAYPLASGTAKHVAFDLELALHVARAFGATDFVMAHNHPNPLCPHKSATDLHAECVIGRAAWAAGMRLAGSYVFVSDALRQ